MSPSRHPAFLMKHRMPHLGLWLKEIRPEYPSGGRIEALCLNLPRQEESGFISQDMLILSMLSPVTEPVHLKWANSPNCWYSKLFQAAKGTWQMLNKGVGFGWLLCLNIPFELRFNPFKEQIFDILNRAWKPWMIGKREEPKCDCKSNNKSYTRPGKNTCKENKREGQRKRKALLDYDHSCRSKVA